jgi:hypothetical protein
VPLLVLLSACGAPTGPNGGSADKPGGGPGSLSRSQLVSASLVKGDIPGYEVAEEKASNAPNGQPKADNAACQPIADVLGDRPDAHAVETVSRGLGSPANPGLAISTSLSSYAPGPAHQLLAGLRSALKSCGAGFSADVQGRTGHYDNIRATAFTVAGDESLSFHATASAEGTSLPLHVVVVRSGDTVVRLMGLSFDAKVEPQVPQEIADKQLTKLAGVISTAQGTG